VATVGWNRETDTFALGQWLRGRIYERRADLSPDGKHLIYFSRKERWASPLMSSWTAISRAPYLKADGFWPKGSCWNGGGLFISDREYWLNGGSECGLFTADQVRVPSNLARHEGYPFDCYFGGECPGVYYHRLMRDGWTMVACDEHRRLADGNWQFQRLNEDALLPHVGAIFEKPLPGGWTLRKLAYATCSRPSRGCYFDKHELENRGLDEIIDCRDWEWADADGDRLVWTTGGRLFAGRLSDRGVDGESILYDFNGMVFAAVEAPY
jgi:hypothetical protein